MEDRHSNTAIWKNYGLGVFWVGSAFFLIYPVCNWLTSLRDTAYPLYLSQELLFPFVPGFVWGYLSMYLLFPLPAFLLTPTQIRRLAWQLVVATLSAGAVFLLIPGELGFVRTVPQDPIYQSLYRTLFDIDLPHNLVPSLHVAFSSLLLLMFIDAEKRVWLRYVWLTWLVVICLSTIFIHQHHLLDVLSALLLSWTIRRVTQGGAHV